eukprot:scaffold7058_cov398-Pinguiococcus_pyrenoidosus.AAC.2
MATSSQAGPMMAWTSQMLIMSNKALVAVLGSQRESYHTHSSVVSGRMSWGQRKCRVRLRCA